MNHADEVIAASRLLRTKVETIRFSPPVAFVYNPLRYAWEPYRQYIETFARSEKKILFLGMNPGPWGMAQTGVPFGEIASVRDWLGVRAGVGKPSREHPSRPVTGFECPHSEVSGRRLWGLFRERFGKPDAFFEKHFVTNYCPLLFIESGGKNITPDKLKKNEAAALFSFCDAFLVRLAEILRPERVIGIGGFAKKRAESALDGLNVRIGTILHPSPSNPAANKNWKETALRQLREQGAWT